MLRGSLREAERWMAETLQSHVSHRVLALYVAQHPGQSWLVSVATILDSCALLIVGGDGLAAAPARRTYPMFGVAGPRTVVAPRENRLLLTFVVRCRAGV